MGAMGMMLNEVRFDLLFLVVAMCEAVLAEGCGFNVKLLPIRRQDKITVVFILNRFCGYSMGNERILIFIFCVDSF
jgi:hypothetical protein